MAQSSGTRARVRSSSAARAGRTESWMKTSVFTIEGMNCDACANTIKSLVEKEAGVRMASVSFTERMARVLYDSQTVQEDRLVDVIQTPGFRVVGRETAGESAR
jgi:copper chaperone CopZ